MAGRNREWKVPGLDSRNTVDGFVFAFCEFVGLAEADGMRVGESWTGLI